MTPGGDLSRLTRARIEVMELRQEIERCTRALLGRIRGEPVTHNKAIATRLTLVLGLCPADELVHRRGVLIRARHVYARSSDVMHGRVRAQNLPQVVVDEWRAIVAELAALTAQICAVAPTAHAASSTQHAPDVAAASEVPVRRSAGDGFPDG